MRSRSTPVRESRRVRTSPDQSRPGLSALRLSTQRKVFMYNTADMPLEELQRRALSAYFETGGNEMPGEPRVQKLGGKRYVTLWRRGKLLACYRVRNDGKLKRLVRLPDGIG